MTTTEDRRWRAEATADCSRRQEEPVDLDIRLDERSHAADLPRAGRFHAEPDAGADRGAGAGARRSPPRRSLWRRRGVDRPGARRGGNRDRQADDGRDDRQLPGTGQEPWRDGSAGSHEPFCHSVERARGNQRERLPQRGERAVGETRRSSLWRPTKRARLARGRRPSAARRRTERRSSDVGIPLLPLGRHRASRRRAESLLVSVLSRRASHDAGRVQAVDPRPSGLVQQLHGRLLGLRPDRRPHRRQAAFRYPRPQDRRPSRSSATGSWPSPAHLARLEARDSRPPPNRSPKSPRRSPLPRELFSACGYVQEALLTDYVLQREEAPSTRAEFRARSGRRSRRGFVIPVTVDDLAANGLLEEAHPQVCWERSVETLTARKDDIAGLAVASDERIEAYLLYVQRGVDPPTFAPNHQRELRRDLAGALAKAGECEILSLRSFVEDGGARLKQLLSRLRAQGCGPSGSRRSTRRKSRRSAWRRSVSAPPAGIYSTQRGRGPSRPVKARPVQRRARESIRQRASRGRERRFALPTST